MQLVTFRKTAGGPQRLGTLLAEGKEILDFAWDGADISFPPNYNDCFDLDGRTLPEANAFLDSILEDPARRAELTKHGAIVARESVTLIAPVPRPGKVLCIGLNYRDHAEESGMELPERPLLFSKFPTSVTGPDNPVRIPRGSEQLDYEAELGVVIGRHAYRVSKEDALDYVLGYTNVNDVSARDFQFSDGQWQRGKSCDTFAPTGPYIATTDEIENPHRLSIRLRLNGAVMQDSNTDQLIFGVPDLIATLSEVITLEPGDVIATGTPPGVGFARKPPVYLKSGDRMEVEIEGLGVLANPVV